jgi:AraC-like DNA-binding protein/ligand-binding sensor protein
MKSLAFGDVARLAVFREYEAAFRKATGVPLKLVSADESRRCQGFGRFENPFCILATTAAASCDGCLAPRARGQNGAGGALLPQQFTCVTGLTTVAVPVVVGRRHVATLRSGQVFRRPPTESDFKRVVRMANGSLAGGGVKRLRKAYFETPVVTEDRFGAIIHLLKVFVQYLGDYASRRALAASTDEPNAVARAKEYVQSQVGEPITLGQVAQQVHLNRYYFCKLFRKATGLTLTEYVSQVRLEKAKTLLGDPSLRVSEIAYAAGFGSIPRFNCVFKQQVGMAPTEFRAALRS